MKQSMVYEKFHDTPAGEFDNLYIDMNGVIHPAFHPEKAAKPTSYEDVFTRLFLYLDRLIAVIQPKKVLYLSIDGPAPRAKMNQQRSRRFRSVIDHNRSTIIVNGIKNAIEDYLKDADVSTSADIADHVKFILEGFSKKDSNSLDKTQDTSESNNNEKTNISTDKLKHLKNLEELEGLSDSNIITPGTKFMQLLTQYLIHYVSYRMSTDDRWKNILVIISDSNVPGEGEQKIFDFIREMRQYPNYDPNTSHVIHGLDADLAMLSLLTHEPNFYIMREDVFDNKTEEFKKPLGLFRVRPLRAKLAKTFLPLIRDCGMNLERIIDDFIFLLYMMGNDFIPQIASVDIGDSIDLVFSEYIQYQSSRKPHEREYFTAPNGRVNIPRLLHFIKIRLVSYEDTMIPFRFQNWSNLMIKNKIDTFDKPKILANNYFKKSIGEEFLQFRDKNPNITDFNALFKRFVDNKKEISQKELFFNPKNVFLDHSITSLNTGWENNYFRTKFRQFKLSDEEVLKLRKNTAIEYLRGVIWVWNYYTMTDTPSWSWFYPYFFGPFFRDFLLLTPEDISKLNEFEYSAPYKPFDQLFSVLPPRSFKSLPKPFQGLEQSNELKYYFPTKFEIDLNGHSERQSFKAIPLLPFIDENRLFSATSDISSQLTPEEQIRNSFSHNIVLFNKSHTDLVKAIHSTNFTNNRLLQNTTPDLSKGTYVELMNLNFAGYLYSIHENHMLHNYIPHFNSLKETPFDNKILFPSFYNETIHVAIFVLEKKINKTYGILPGFNFDETPKLVDKWFGNDRREEFLKVDSDNEDDMELEKDQVSTMNKIPKRLELNDTNISKKEDIDNIIDSGENVENLSENEDTSNLDKLEQNVEMIEIYDTPKDSKRGKTNAVHRKHGYHKKELNQEELFARASNVPDRFAFCEKSQLYPRPIMENQAEFSNKQKKKKNKKRKRISDDELKQKTRQVAKGKQEIQKEKKRRKVT